jgi:hypothetical protein
MNYKTLLLSLFSMVVASSSIHADGLTNAKLDAYVAEHRPYADMQLKLYGIPVSFTLAQGIHESAYGQSELAVKAYNFFGVKSKTGWQGQTYHKETEELENGKVIVINAAFRSYENIEQAYYDRSNFLRSSARYAHLFDLTTVDYVGWARGLAKAGYATASQYGDRIITIIEQHQLYKYDQLLDKSEIAWYQKQLQPQLQMNRINAPVISHSEMYAHMEAVFASCEREYTTMQQQIAVLKKEIAQQKANNSEIYQELFSRIAALELYIIEQHKLLLSTQACVRDLERQLQNINNSDPLKTQFTADGQPRTQLEFYPITKNTNKNIFYNHGKKVVNLPKDKDLFWVANEYNIDYRDLLAYNDLSPENLIDTTIMRPNMFVYLEPKGNSSSDENRTYTVRNGENLHTVAQLEGIKLDKLAQRNYLNLDKGEEPAANQTLFINKKATDKPVVRSNVNTSFGSGGVTVPAPKK